MTIDMLPDDVLVEIFNSFVNVYNQRRYIRRNTWHALVRVCRRWRYLVFASPRSLNLRLNYSGHGPMSEIPDTWLIFPVVLVSSLVGHLNSGQRWDNMASALESEHHNRISEIHIFDITESRWERFAAAMQKPFPELTSLRVWLDFGDRDLLSVLPDSFLGRSVPRLRELRLRSIPFPSITTLLLSAKSLVTLSLWNIPDSGYISPDAMATAFTAMTTLETLRLSFRSPRSRPNPASRPLHLPTRFVLPALTELEFNGVYEYLEGLLARIDVPALYKLIIIFFMDLDFDLPHLHRLIGHAEEFKALDQATVLILNRSIQLSIYPKTGVVDHHSLLNLQIICEELDQQISSLAQVCRSSFPLVSAMEDLQIWEDDHRLLSSPLAVNMETGQWLELLDPFTALKNLHLTETIAAHVCSALQELSGERVTEVLPTLQRLFIDSPSSYSLPEGLRKAIKTFVDARRRSGHPVSVHCTYWIGRSMDITEDLVSGD